jgi:hypothetical protein
MTTEEFAGVFVGLGTAVAVPNASYASADPAPFNVNTEGATSLRVELNVSAISGSGCTVTVTVSGVQADASASLYTLCSKAITATGYYEIFIDPRIPFSNSPLASTLNVSEPLPAVVEVACVGSGTKTTLVYDVAVTIGD